MKLIKNVLLITKEFQSEFQRNVGGTGVFYKNLADGLADQGVNVHVFGSSKRSFSFQKDGLSVYFVKDYFKKYFIMEFLRSATGKFQFLEHIHFKIYDCEIKYLEHKLSKFIAGKNIDIIETHDWEGISRIAEHCKIPYVIRCHGSWSVLSRFFGYGAAKGKIDSEVKAFQNAKHIITVSQSNEKMVRTLFGEKNYHLIYNGIDTDFYKPQESIKIKQKSIYYLGNISTEKGADIALNAFIKLSKKHTDITLHFVGKETNLTAQLTKEIAAHSLENRVYFYGHKKSTEVIQLLSQAEVLIFPSKGETFGLGLIEAMSLQKPVICSNLNVFKEIITDDKNGLIANDELDFAEKILEILTHPDLASELSQEARKTVVENFSLNQMVINTLKYYSEIIN